MDAPDLEGREKRRGDEPIPGQVIHVGGDPGQTVGRGKGVEEAGAEQGGIGVVEVRRDGDNGTMTRTDPPSRSVQVTFSGSRVARRRQVAAAPNQTVASLHSPSQADQLDLERRAENESRSRWPGRA